MIIKVFFEFDTRSRFALKSWLDLSQKWHTGGFGYSGGREKWSMFRNIGKRRVVFTIAHEFIMNPPCSVCSFVPAVFQQVSTSSTVGSVENGNTRKTGTRRTPSLSSKTTFGIERGTKRNCWRAFPQSAPLRGILYFATYFAKREI